MRSRVGTHRSRAEYPRDALFKGCNIQEFPVRDTSVGDTSTLHQKGCNVCPSPTDVSPTGNSWMLHPIDKLSLGYFVPDRTIPSLNSDSNERSDTRLPTAARFSAAKRWSSMCGPSMHPTEGCQSNKPGQGHRRSRPDAPLIN
jgi:hypothetical protein